LDFQVVIVGGGPAAHSAALIFGRSRKRVLMCDEGRPANRIARHSHSFFTRDGTPPLDLRQTALNQLEPYDTVEFVSERVTKIERTSDGFQVDFRERKAASTQLVLLCLGMDMDDPGIAGFDELWGDTVIHCPYCHGWEVRDLPWAVYLSDVNVPMDPIRLRSWSDDIVVIVGDGVSVPSETMERWEEIGFKVERGAIESLHAAGGRLESIELTGGVQIYRSVLLYAPPRKHAAIVTDLQLELGDDGCVVIDESGRTNVEGIYAAGDMTTTRHQIVIAASSGAQTAIAMDVVLAASREER